MVEDMITQRADLVLHDATPTVDSHSRLLSNLLLQIHNLLIVQMIQYLHHPIQNQKAGDPKASVAPEEEAPIADEAAVQKVMRDPRALRDLLTVHRQINKEEHGNNQNRMTRLIEVEQVVPLPVAHLQVVAALQNQRKMKSGLHLTDELNPLRNAPQRISVGCEN